MKTGIGRRKSPWVGASIRVNENLYSFRPLAKVCSSWANVLNILSGQRSRNMADRYALHPQLSFFVPSYYVPGGYNVLDFTVIKPHDFFLRRMLPNVHGIGLEAFHRITRSTRNNNNNNNNTFICFVLNFTYIYINREKGKNFVPNKAWS